MRVLVGTFVAAALCLPALSSAWTDRWDHSKRFEAAGHAEIDCDGEDQAASCCICKSIVGEIETQLDNTPNDHDMDVVFRISEEKKQIKYSRSEARRCARILEVLDNVCSVVPQSLSLDSKKGKKILNDACTAFVGEYEDELTRTFFNDFTPAMDRMCVSTLQVCKTEAEFKAEREDL